MVCLIKDEPCDFWDALNLSVHSMSTIGFGSIVPQSALTHSAVAVEFWIAVLMGAGAGGLLFSRVSTASSRVAFSRRCLGNQHPRLPDSHYADRQRAAV